MANYAVIFLISYTLFIAPTFSTNLSGSFGVNQLLSYFLDSWITIVYTSVPDLENVFTETFINSFSPIALTESELIDQSFAPVRKLYFGQVFIILPSPKSVIITLYRQARLQINHPTTAIQIVNTTTTVPELVQLNSEACAKSTKLFLHLIYIFLKDEKQFEFTDTVLYLCENCVSNDRNLPVGAYLIPVNQTDSNFALFVRNKSNEILEDIKNFVFVWDDRIWESVQLAEHALAAFLQTKGMVPSPFELFLPRNFEIDTSTFVLTLFLNYSVSERVITNLVGPFSGLSPCRLGNFTFRPTCSCFEGIYFGLADLTFPLLAKRKKEFVVVRAISYNFITCDGVVEIVSRFALISPFSTGVWFFIGLTVVVVSLIFYLIAIFKKCAPTLIECFLKAVAILLEQSESNSGNRICSENIVYSIILFLFLVVSSSYKGKIVSYLLDSPRMELKWHKFNELENFVIFSSEKKDFFNQNFYNFTKGFASNGFPFDIGFIMTYAYTLYNLEQRNSSGNLKTNEWATTTDLPLSNGCQLLKYCNNSALAIKNHKAKAALRDGNSCFSSSKNLQEQKRRFGVGSDTFGATPIAWHFDLHASRKITRKLNHLMESGIYDLWESWVQYREDKKIEVDESNPSSASAKVLGLNDQVLSIFGLFVFCIGVAVFIIIAEMCVSFANKKTYRYCSIFTYY